MLRAVRYAQPVKQSPARQNPGRAILLAQVRCHLVHAPTFDPMRYVQSVESEHHTGAGMTTTHSPDEQQPPGPRQQRIELLLAELRTAVQNHQMILAVGDRISEADAARLLKLQPESLAKKRADRSGPAGYRIPIGRSKISYKLYDIAAWIESRRR